MKYFLGLSFILFGLFSCAQKEADSEKKEATETVPTASIKNNNATAEVVEEGPLGAFEFEETSFDFGTITAGDVVEHKFSFKNTGEAPIVISETKVSCGCTTPSYTEVPVAPGETGEILVKFNSKNKKGVQNKKVRIKANVPGGEYVISIKTIVEALPEGPKAQ